MKNINVQNPNIFNKKKEINNSDINKVQHYFDDHSDDFDTIYTKKKSKKVKYLKIFDNFFRKSIYLRYLCTFQEIEDCTNKSILDLGCGSGIYAIELCKKGANVTGIDISEKMLNIATNRAKELGIGDKIDFIQMDFFKYNPENKFDYSIAMGVFDYIKEPETLINKMVSMTNKKIMFSCPVKYDIWTPQRKFRYFMKNCPIYFYDEKKIKKVMNNLGIKNFKVKKIKRDYFVVISIFSL